MENSRNNLSNQRYATLTGTRNQVRCKLFYFGIAFVSSELSTFASWPDRNVTSSSLDIQDMPAGQEKQSQAEFVGMVLFAQIYRGNALSLKYLLEELNIVGHQQIELKQTVSTNSKKHVIIGC